MEQNSILHTTLSLDSDIPLYAQLVGIIKRSISTGALPVGALLPSEAELCRCLSISRNTVRQAIGEKPGSLAGILELLFKAGVNLRKLESRPLRSQSWKYAFFADLETNLLKSELSGVLAELRNTCHSFRLLGCYTAGE